jgi:ubiquinone/menaquinone biosynthesis C-methylase UbiE
MSALSPAEIYERFMVPAVFAPWAELLIDRAGPKPGERVLDVGCGSGIVSRTAARRTGPSGSGTGVDLNPHMVAAARNAPIEPDSAPIEWLEGSADALPVASASFDLVTMQQVLQFVPDKLKALQEAHRVLRPGGRLAFAVWQREDLHEAHMAIDRVIAKHLGSTALDAGFALHDETEIRSKVESAGFEIASFEQLTQISRYVAPEEFARPFLISITAGIVSFRQLDGDSREALLDRMVPDLTEVMRGYVADGVVAFPWHAHVVVATAR